MIGKKIDKKIMEVLKKHIGKNITVEMVWFGESQIITDAILKEVEPEFIVIIESKKKKKIPFKDYDIAIERITSDKILYDNPEIIDPSLFYRISDDFLPK